MAILKNKPLDVPDVTMEPKFEFLPTPFNWKYMTKWVTGSNSDVPPKRFLKKLIFKHVRAKYMLLLIFMGATIQTALEKLKNDRELDLIDVRKFCFISNHPLVKVAGMETRPNTQKQEAKKKPLGLRDSEYLLWTKVLEDILLQVSENMKSFMILDNISNMPTYAEKKAMTPNQK